MISVPARRLLYHKHMDRFVYSPESSDKLVETIFIPSGNIKNTLTALLENIQKHFAKRCRNFCNLSG